MPVSYIDLGRSINVISDSSKKTPEASNFIANDEPYLTVLKENYLLNKLVGYGPEFDNPLACKKVVVSYSPPSGNQYKHFTFRLRDSVFKSYASWNAASAKDTGTLREVIIVSSNRAYTKLASSSFTSNDNITVS